MKRISDFLENCDKWPKNGEILMRLAQDERKTPVFCPGYNIGLFLVESLTGPLSDIHHFSGRVCKLLN